MTTTCALFTNIGIRQQDGSRKGRATRTKPHVIITHYYINIYTMSDNEERKDFYTGDISYDGIGTANMLVRQVSFLGEKL